MTYPQRRRRIESSDEDEAGAGSGFVVQKKMEIPVKRSARLDKPKKRILHKGRRRVASRIVDEDEIDSDSELLTLNTLTVPRVPGCSVPGFKAADNAWWSRPEKISKKKQNPTTSFVDDEAEETGSDDSEEDPASESEDLGDQNEPDSLYESDSVESVDDDSSIGSFLVDGDDEENSDAWRTHLMDDDYFNGDCVICAAPCNEINGWKCPCCRRIFCATHNSPRFVCDCDE